MHSKVYSLSLMLVLICTLLASCVRATPTPTSEISEEQTEAPLPEATYTPRLPTTTAEITTATIAETAATDDPHSTLHLQELLLALGYAEAGLADGVVDEQFNAALYHFKLLNGLPINPKVDATIWEVIEANPIRYYLPRVFPGKVYGVDASVEMCDDHALQDQLASLSYLVPGSDEWSAGAFGPETQKALKEFQKQYGFIPNGKPNLETWQTLFSPLTFVRQQDNPDPWQTSLYAADSNVYAMAWDGAHLWLAVSKGTTVYDNHLLRIDPSAHPAEAVQVIRTRECNAPDAQIANMIYAAGKLWLLYYYDKQGNPEPMMQTVDVESGVAGSPFKFATCADGYCVPAFAMGATKGTLWVAASDRAYGLDLNSGAVKASRPVGYMASGEMAYDGQCFWYLGEAGAQSFNPAGGACRGGDTVNVLGYSVPETDGKQVWTRNFDGTLTQLNLATGVSILTEPVTTDPVAMTYANEVLWILDRSNNTVVGMSTLDGSLGDPISLDGESPAYLLHETNFLWIYFEGSASVQRLDVSGYTITPTARTSTPVVTATPTATPPVLARTLKLETPNLRGDDVLMLQEQLLALGYSEVGVPDGIFGRMTDAAVRHYQEDNALEVDGIVGPITWGMIFK